MSRDYRLQQRSTRHRRHLQALQLLQRLCRTRRDISRWHALRPVHQDIQLPRRHYHHRSFLQLRLQSNYSRLRQDQNQSTIHINIFKPQLLSKNRRRCRNLARRLPRRYHSLSSLATTKAQATLSGRWRREERLGGGAHDGRIGW